MESCFWELRYDTRASIISTSSTPKFAAETCLAASRSMTANVASVNNVMMDPSTVDSRLSLRLGTTSKHSFDTPENDPIVLLECFELLSRHRFT